MGGFTRRAIDRASGPQSSAVAPIGRYRWAALAMLVWVGSGPGCFTGKDARGLSCEQDSDCGLQLRCEDGICGGAETTLATATTRATTSGSSTASDTATGDSSGSVGSSTGPEPPVCGNGRLEDGEGCDLGASANADPRSRCDLGCQPALFWSDMSGAREWQAFAYRAPAPGQVGPQAPPTGVPQWRPLGEAWGSGPYSPVAVATAMLSAASFELPANGRPGFRLAVWVRHRFAFDAEIAAATFPDGGQVGLRAGEAGFVELPPPVSKATIAADAYCVGCVPIEDDLPGENCPGNRCEQPCGACGSVCHHINPLAGGRAFVGRSQPADTLIDTVFEVPVGADELTGVPLQLVFTAGYDCSNLPGWPSPPDPWLVDHVVVKWLPVP